METSWWCAISLLRDYQFRELATFGGPWLLEDATTVDVRGALKAQNIEYVSGGVLARHGYATVGFSSSSVVNGMFAWYAPFHVNYGASYSDSALAIQDGTGIAIRNLKSGTLIGSLSGPSAGTPSFVGVGLRLYMAFFDHNQAASGVPQCGFAIAGGTGGAIIQQDLLFDGPSEIIPSMTEPGAGVVTAGIHRIGYLLEFPGGFTTRVSPDNGTATPPSLVSFTPVSFTAAGSKNFTAALHFGISEFGAYSPIAVSLVMTTVTNLNQYYIVPGSRTAYTQIMSITASISDADLSSQGIDATNYLYWLTRQPFTTGAGAAPFTCSHIALFGDRMAYKASQADNQGNSIDCLYISERNNYQSITPDQHVLQLPGQAPITTMFRMGTSNYILGPHEIWAALDNGDVPVTWSAPYLIDGRHGTLSIHGVEVAPSGQYAWIADQSGLYLFAGSPITALPMSYQQTPDWNRINWNAAYCIKIKDDASNKKVYLMVPLDGAVTPSHIMVFDYTDGATWQTVRYSLDNLSGYALGAMELVRNDLSGQATGNQQRIELWVASTSAAAILRRTTDNDTNPFRDNGAAINSIYRTCPLPGRDQAGGVIQLHHGFHARLKGSGSMTPVMYDTDSIRSFTCRTATLSTTPDADLLFAADLRGEVAAVEFNTNTLDTFWTLAYLRYYHSPYIMQR